MRKRKGTLSNARNRFFLQIFLEVNYSSRCLVLFFYSLIESLKGRLLPPGDEVHLISSYLGGVGTGRGRPKPRIPDTRFMPEIQRHPTKAEGDEKKTKKDFALSIFHVKTFIPHNKKYFFQEF